MLPCPATDVRGLPDGLPVEVWDGIGSPPDAETLASVEFFVIPYGRTAAGRPVHLGRRRRPGGARSPGRRSLQRQGVHDTSTAELAVTLTLASLRGIPDFVRAQGVQEWRGGFRPALADRTFLLVGYGPIAAAIEDRIAPFECAFLRVARTVGTVPRGRVHAIDELPELLPRADMVILTVPLTDRTRGLVDARFLASMPDRSLLVNVSRGAVVDTGALLTEVSAGRLHAALDVTDPEPLPAGHPLWNAPHTLISPHVGGNSSAFRPRALRLIRTQVLHHLAGEPLENVVLPREP